MDMNKKEHEILASIIEDMKKSDDKIETLERLYFEVKKMLNLKK